MKITWSPSHATAVAKIYWTYSYSPIDDDTASSGFGGVLVICTETTQKVIEVQRLSGEIQRLWRHSRDLQVVVGADGIFRAVSPAWREILGHEPDTVVGQSFLNFIWPEDAELTEAALDTAASMGILLTSKTAIAIRMARRDGFRWRTSVRGTSFTPTVVTLPPRKRAKRVGAH